MSAPHVEHVEMTGHIVDSLLLPKVLDAILSRGGRYHIDTLRLGERQDDAAAGARRSTGGLERVAKTE